MFNEDVVAEIRIPLIDRWLDLIRIQFATTKFVCTPHAGLKHEHLIIKGVQTATSIDLLYELTRFTN